MSTTNLARNLRLLRQEQELSQQQLGDKAGLPQQYVSALERGIRLRDPADVAKLARALGVTEAVLLAPTITVAEVLSMRASLAAAQSA